MKGLRRGKGHHRGCKDGGRIVTGDAETGAGRHGSLVSLGTPCRQLRAPALAAHCSVTRAESIRRRRAPERRPTVIAGRLRGSGVFYDMLSAAAIGRVDGQLTGRWPPVGPSLVSPRRAATRPEMSAVCQPGLLFQLQGFYCDGRVGTSTPLFPLRSTGRYLSFLITGHY